ncbi:DUF4249 domain-containing protein [Flavivirga eckloniae]|uniref:DUF4249 domain-containing protein n=1 Tax=Flavivirga eckloniae TaxID=1803846 RepID=A0A2K9PY58_9FLAO|nr:DUF4249 domain-containing protein [Flavivirga eckloniae]AUP81467.1 DUF4249 domain-containing protein [Flavivirga eckloniae]
MKKTKRHIIYLILVNVIFNSCVEPINIDNSSTSEDVIVIEAIITNELKRHEIKISKTFELNQDGPSPESNAEVKIIDASQNVYNFNEDTPGKYISTSEFAATPNNTYQLSITTSKGDSYTSNPLTLTNETQIEDVNYTAETNENGTLGVSIFVNSFDPLGNSKYYRYEYEETYKIIAPYWSNLDAILTSATTFYTAQKTKEERVCYNSLSSTGIIQTETTKLSEDRVTQKLVRFIPANDFIITHRYSILVKQYVQSLESYTYFKTLNELSGSESLLSQNQPGFISSNIVSVNNPNQKVLGFFDVSSVSSKRIFFNFRDLFPFPEKRPAHIVPCELLAPRVNATNGNSLVEIIREGRLKYYTLNGEPPFEPPLIPDGGPYVMVIPKCGDCTTLGSNVVPDFWVE